MLHTDGRQFSFFFNDFAAPTELLIHKLVRVFFAESQGIGSNSTIIGAAQTKFYIGGLVLDINFPQSCSFIYRPHRGHFYHRYFNANHCIIFSHIYYITSP